MLNRIVPDLVLDDPDESPNEMWALNCLAYTYYAWDEEENVTTTATMPWSMPGGESVVLEPAAARDPGGRRRASSTLVDDVRLVPVRVAEVQLLTPMVRRLDYYQTWMGVKY